MDKEKPRPRLQQKPQPRTSAPLQNPGSGTSTDPVPIEAKRAPDPVHFAGHVFARMAAIYGHPWSSQWGTPEMLRLAQHEWAREISAFTITQVNRAINESIHRGERFPPNLPEFIALCRVYRDHDRHVERVKQEAIERQREKEIPPEVIEERKSRVREMLSDVGKKLGINGLGDEK